MTDSQKPRFEKHVAIKEIDHENRTVTGAVLVPWEVDHQRDWLRPEGVEAMFNPSPDDGVMHAGFPHDAVTTEHRLLDEPEMIGDEEYPAKTWVADRTYHDDELWLLVEDGVLNGFSIGGEVTKEVSYSGADELPDEVVFPDGVDPGPVTEIVNGATDEVSDVDIPAVPRALYATAKSIGKNLYDDATGRDDFIETMVDRGHSEEDAGRLYDYLEAVEKTSPEAVAKFFDRAQKFDFESCVESVMADGHDREADEAICGAQYHDQKMTVPNNSDDQPDDATKWRKFKSWVLSGAANPLEPDDGDLGLKAIEVSGATFAKAADVVKEGRTLNAENRQALMAAHDAIEAALASDMDHEWNSFTDDIRYDFDIASYGDRDEEKTKTIEKLTEEQGALVIEAIEEFERTQGEAPFGDFREWVWHKHDDWDSDKMFAVEMALDEFRSWTRQMHDDQPVTDEFAGWIGSETDTDITMSKDDNPEDPPEWAKGLIDSVEQIDERVKELEDEDAQKSPDDIPEWAEDLAKTVEDLDERVDKVSQATASSQQLGGSDGQETNKADVLELETEVFGR